MNAHSSHTHTHTEYNLIKCLNGFVVWFVVVVAFHVVEICIVCFVLFLHFGFFTLILAVRCSWMHSKRETERERKKKNHNGFIGGINAISTIWKSGNWAATATEVILNIFFLHESMCVCVWFRRKTSEQRIDGIFMFPLITSVRQCIKMHILEFFILFFFLLSKESTESFKIKIHTDYIR